VNEGIYGECIFVFVYEKRRIKPVEIVLSGGGERGITMEGVNLTKIYYKHICKYHSISPVQLLYANKKFKNFKNGLPKLYPGKTRN
jgi:hypothetical protein